MWQPQKRALVLISGLGGGWWASKGGGGNRKEVEGGGGDQRKVATPKTSACARFVVG